jgi:hypothetical protein
MCRRHAGCQGVICLAASLFALGLTGVAEAGKGFILWGHGEHIKDCGALPGTVRDRLAGLDPDVARSRIGYLYGFFDIFWLDIWTWIGRHVLYVGDSYYDLEGELLEVFAEAGGKEHLHVPLGYRVPPGLVTGVGVIGAMVLWERVKTRRTASSAGPST